MRVKVRVSLALPLPLIHYCAIATSIITPPSQAIDLTYSVLGCAPPPPAPAAPACAAAPPVAGTPMVTRVVEEVWPIWGEVWGRCRGDVGEI